MPTIGVINYDKIASLAETLQWPRWIVEAVAIEYLPCRRFVAEGNFILFDFSLLKADNFRQLSRPLVILQNITLFHNVTGSVLRQRMLRGLVGAPMAPIANSDLILPHGKVNKRFQVMPLNAISAWDMKLGVDCSSVVIDGDDLFQWRVKKDDSSAADRGDAWFDSDVFSPPTLREMKSIHDGIYNTFRQPYPTTPVEEEELRAVFGAYYATLEETRQKLRAELISFHDSHKNSPAALAGCNDEEPLTITVFDEPTIQNGQLQVRSFVEPIFFRSAMRAMQRAAKAAERGQDDAEAAYWIAEEIEAAAECITLSAMCLEAFINGLIRERFESISDDLERTEVRTKWLAVPRMLGHHECFDKSAMPFQGFAKVVKWRNLLVHYKHSFELPEDHAGRRVSKLHKVCNATNAQTSVAAVEGMIQKLRAAMGMPPPRWLDNHGGWLAELATQQHETE